MTTDACARCAAALDRLSQGVLPGTGIAALCSACGRADEARDLLRALPHAASPQLSTRMQRQLQTIRRAFTRTGTVSERQLGELLAIREAAR